MEKSEKQKSGNKAAMLRQGKKILFILCTKSYAYPEYLFASKVGLGVCRQEDEQLLSSMVNSKAPEEWVSQEVTLMEDSLEKEVFRVAVSERVK